jgi:hypothetical protein
LISLLNKQSLTVVRSDRGGTLLANGTFTPASTSEIPIKCNVQPFQQGTIQVKLPEGYTTDDARIVYTKTPVMTSSQFTKKVADRTEIDGLTHFAYRSQKWEVFGLNPDHYAVVFLREDQATL